MSLHPFSQLTPELILDAVESLGLMTDGRQMALNSYENRVYQVGIEDADPLIAKFYRPDRWSIDQIREEHQLTLTLAANEPPVVAPMVINQETIHHYCSFSFTLYPRRGGHAPELDNLDTLYELGKTLGQIHAITRGLSFQHRPIISLESYAIESAEFISEHFIPGEYKTPYRTLCDDLIGKMQEILQQHTRLTQFPIHGDFHSGNILWRDGQPNLVDFDDSRTGPAIQDIWMLLSGDRHQQALQLDEILEGYNHFSEFDPKELRLIETYRTFRMMHYAAWLARRWQDPAFPLSFPWFNTHRYWSEHILELREQLAALDEPAISLTQNQ